VSTIDAAAIRRTILTIVAGRVAVLDLR